MGKRILDIKDEERVGGNKKGARNLSFIRYPKGFRTIKYKTRWTLTNNWRKNSVKLVITRRGRKIKGTKWELFSQNRRISSRNELISRKVSRRVKKQGNINKGTDGISFKQ